MNKETLVEYVKKLHKGAPHIFTAEAIAEAEAFESSDPAEIIMFTQQLLIKYTRPKKDK